MQKIKVMHITRKEYISPEILEVEILVESRILNASSDDLEDPENGGEWGW